MTWVERIPTLEFRHPTPSRLPLWRLALNGAVMKMTLSSQSSHLNADTSLRVCILLFMSLMFLSSSPLALSSSSTSQVTAKVHPQRAVRVRGCRSRVSPGIITVKSHHPHVHSLFRTRQIGLLGSSKLEMEVVVAVCICGPNSNFISTFSSYFGDREAFDRLALFHFCSQCQHRVFQYP